MGRLGAILAGPLFGLLLGAPAAANTIATYSLDLPLTTSAGDFDGRVTGVFSVDLTTHTVFDAAITTPDGAVMHGTTYTGLPNDTYTLTATGTQLVFHNTTSAVAGVSGQLLTLLVVADLSDLSAPPSVGALGNESFYFVLCGGLCITRFTSGIIDRTGITVTPPPPSVPIPAALPLLATALGGMGVVGWRRKQRRAA